MWAQNMKTYIGTTGWHPPESVHHSQLSRSVVSDSLRPHGLQHTRLPIHHQLPKLAQTHVHWVSDAIQPSYPLSSPSPVFNFSQHQGLFQWISSSHQVAKVLKFHHRRGTRQPGRQNAQSVDGFLPSAGTIQPWSQRRVYMVPVAWAPTVRLMCFCLSECPKCQQHISRSALSLWYPMPGGTTPR